MATASATRNTAKAIYEYAGKNLEGIPDWEDLAPTIQIAYIEEAEVAISTICEYIEFLARLVEVDGPDAARTRGTMLALAELLDPRVPEN